MNKCLSCYEPLDENEIDFHSKCCKKVFGVVSQPVIEHPTESWLNAAKEMIASGESLTGVQPKLSSHLIVKPNQQEFKATKITYIGEYIVKFQSPVFPSLPEIEDLTMHLAQLTKIKVVPHSLVRLGNQELAYLCKRIDRTANGQIHLEDMAQAMGILSEHKYRGSYEGIAKALKQFSVNPGIDILSFYEIVLFSFLTGNADMHHKNFSLLQLQGNEFALSPAYDLVNTALANPGDTEELALNLNGKKNKIKQSDFERAFTNAGITAKQQSALWKKFLKIRPLWEEFLAKSFLSDTEKNEYQRIVQARFNQLGLV